MVDRSDALPRSLTARLARFGVIVLALVAGGYLFSRLATLGEAERVGSAVTADEAVHLHGIGVNPADGRVYLATHTGLLRISHRGQAVRIADRYQDTMGFAVLGPDEFVSSGHPDLREDLPPRLGLIRSEDAGQTWASVSLSAEADLHAIIAVGERLYAADATAQRLIRSDDGGRTWVTVAEVELSALAVSPDGRQMVGAAMDGRPLRSDDGGKSWTGVVGPPLTSLTWDPDRGPIAAAADGTILAGRDGERSWSRVGQVPGDNPVLITVDGQLIAATDGAIISRSSDGGRTWRTKP